jgi:UDP-N-acetyl-D-glucosamine dehydrogenase
LGYVGLPLAVTLAEAGYCVTGIDRDACKVDAINRGESYIPDVSSEGLQLLVSQGLLSATTEPAALAGCDAVSICVPTPLRKTGDPDISYVVAATDDLVRYLHPGMVLVLESTTYPGTTTEVVLPRLEGVMNFLKNGLQTRKPKGRAGDRIGVPTRFSAKFITLPHAPLGHRRSMKEAIFRPRSR